MSSYSLVPASTVFLNHHGRNCGPRKFQQCAEMRSQRIVILLALLAACEPALAQVVRVAAATIQQDNSVGPPAPAAVPPKPAPVIPNIRPAGRPPTPPTAPPAAP